jgi:hypothetical protein
VDASGSPGPGFFYGNNLWLGSYAQCEDLSNTRPFEISYEVVKHPDSTPHDFPPFDLGFFVAHIEHNSTMQHHTQLPLEVSSLNLNLQILSLLCESYRRGKYGDYFNGLYNAVLCDIAMQSRYIIDLVNLICPYFRLTRLLQSCKYSAQLRKLNIIVERLQTAPRQFNSNTNSIAFVLNSSCTNSYNT